VQLIDLDNEKVLKTWSFDETVYSYSFSPDGRYLAVSLVTGPVYILRLQDPPKPVRGK
jgi:hypothetical protein